VASVKPIRKPLLVLATFAVLAALTAQPARAADNDGSAEIGHDIYSDFCSRCHGENMVNTGGLAFDLRTFPKNDFDRFKNSVQNGKNQGMPAWRDQVSDDDIADLWAYVKTGGK
jgi:mono/diheme cytochrome c family protein